MSGKNNSNLNPTAGSNNNIPSTVAQKTFYAGPISGGDAPPAFRALQSSDLPAGNNNFNNLNTNGPLYATSSTSVTTLNPAGSSIGQALVSGGAGSPPFYSSQPLLFRVTYDANASLTIGGNNNTTGTYASLLLNGIAPGGTAGALFLGDPDIYASTNNAIYGGVGVNRGTTGNNMHIYTPGNLYKFLQSNYYLFQGASLAFMVGPSGRVGINRVINAGETSWLTIDTAATNHSGLRISGSGANVGAGIELNNTTSGTTFQVYTDSSGVFTVKNAAVGTPALQTNTLNAVAFSGSYGTSGQILSSTGSGSAPQWVNVNNSFSRLVLNNSGNMNAITIQGVATRDTYIEFNNTTDPGAGAIQIGQFQGGSNNTFFIGRSNTQTKVCFNQYGALGVQGPTGNISYGANGQFLMSQGSSTPFIYKTLSAVVPPPFTFTIFFNTNTAGGNTVYEVTRIADYGANVYFTYTPWSRGVSRVEFKMVGGGGGAASSGGLLFFDNACGGGGGGAGYIHTTIQQSDVPNGAGQLDLFVAKGGSASSTNTNTAGQDGADSGIFHNGANIGTAFGGKGAKTKTGNRTWSEGGIGGGTSVDSTYANNIIFRANGGKGSGALITGDTGRWAVQPGGTSGMGLANPGFQNIDITSFFTNGDAGQFGSGNGGTGGERKASSSTEGAGGAGGSGCIIITEYYSASIV